MTSAVADTEAVAWTLSAAPDRPRGSSGCFRQARSRVRSSPTAVRTHRRGLRLVTTLAETGPRTVTLDTAAACATPLEPRTPLRSITVLGPASGRPVLVGLRAALPAPGETLEVGVDSTDQDADGRDDVRITVRVGAGGKTAAAVIGYLDWAAGPSP